MARRPRPDDGFFEELYRLCSQLRNDQAIRHASRTLGALLAKEQYEHCDRILRSVDLDMIPTEVMLPILRVTATSKEKLPSRRYAFREIRKRIIRYRGEGAAMKSLEGLE